MNEHENADPEKYPADWEEDEERRPRFSPLVRAVALVTALAFLGLVLASVWPYPRLQLADLVARSLELERDIDIKRLQEAVVRIDVVSSRPGFPPAADRRSGTGFNIRPDGLIVTNHHVIEGALNMSVTFPGGKVQRAVSWASRPEWDLAVIKLQGENLPVVPVSDEGIPRPGDRIRVVGNPLGLNNIVSEGRVDRLVRIKGKPETVFSIDAPVYPGNSGSPVFDADGEAVGVVFARYEQEVDGEQRVFGLAVPIREVFAMSEVSTEVSASNGSSER